MTAAGHPRGYGVAKAYRAGCCLRLGRGDDLEHVGPVEVLVRIGRLGGVVTRRRDYEAVIGMDKSIRS